jgi:hypothetical protein
MSERPQTWHYGLVARWWAEFNHGGPEIEYFRRFVQRDGQPRSTLPAAPGACSALPPRGAGFVDVIVYGDHKEQEPTADSEFLVFVARRP